MEEVQPDILQHLSDALQEALKGSSGPRALTIGGAKMMAEIMTRLDKTTEGTIMSKLTERDATLAETIRSLMFVFDDLVKIDDRGMQELLKEVSKEELPLALKAAAPDVVEKVLRNMSSRAAQMLKEDMEARGPVKLSDAEKAQQNILKICRKLEEEGRVVIGGAGESMV
jgi:flagellar motor switch protein FliG